MSAPVRFRWHSLEVQPFAVIQLDRDALQWLADSLPQKDECAKQLRAVLYASDPARLQEIADRTLIA